MQTFIDHKAYLNPNPAASTELVKKSRTPYASEGLRAEKDVVAFALIATESIFLPRIRSIKRSQQLVGNS